MSGTDLLLTEPLDLVASPVRRMCWPEAYPNQVDNVQYDYQRSAMLQDEVKRLALYCKQLEEEVSILKGDNTVLTDTLGQRDVSLAQLQDTLNQRDAQVTGLRMQVVQLNGDVAEGKRLAQHLDGTIQQLSARCSELKLWGEKQAGDITTLTAQLGAREEEVDSLNATVGGMNQKHADDATAHQELQDTLDTLQKRYGEQNHKFEKEMKKLHQQLMNANDRALLLQTDNGDLGTQVTTLRNLNTKSTVNYDNEVQGLHAKLSEAAQQAVTLQGLLDNRSRELQQEQSQVANLCTEVETLNQQALQLGDQCAEAELNNQQLQNLNTQLGQTCQVKDDQLGALRGDLTNLQGDLGNLGIQLRRSVEDRRAYEQQSNDAILSLEQDKQLLNTNLVQTNDIVEEQVAQVNMLGSNLAQTEFSLTQTELQRNMAVSNLQQSRFVPPQLAPYGFNGLNGYNGLAYNGMGYSGLGPAPLGRGLGGLGGYLPYGY